MYNGSNIISNFIEPITDTHFSHYQLLLVVGGISQLLKSSPHIMLTCT